MAKSTHTQTRPITDELAEANKQLRRAVGQLAELAEALGTHFVHCPMTTEEDVAEKTAMSARFRDVPNLRAVAVDSAVLSHLDEVDAATTALEERVRGHIAICTDPQAAEGRS